MAPGSDPGGKIHAGRWETSATVHGRVLLSLDNVLARYICLGPYHDATLEAYASRGVPGLWRHQHPTGLSTPDSSGIQPCNRPQRHLVTMEYGKEPA